MTFAVRTHMGDSRATSINLTISADTTNYNIFTAAGSPSSAANVVLTINGGIYVYDQSGSLPALTSGSGWATGSSISVVNNGLIIGGPGYGPQTLTNPTATGNNGGAAISALVPLTVTNNGTIAGGGGGGGTGGVGSTSSSSPTVYAGSGGAHGTNLNTGATMTSTGSGGPAGTGSPSSGTTPSRNSSIAGGWAPTGGLAGSFYAIATVPTPSATFTGSGTFACAASGAGGGWGGPGGWGQTAIDNTSTTRVGGAGGSSGPFVDNLANVTWVATGNRYGVMGSGSHHTLLGSNALSTTTPTNSYSAYTSINLTFDPSGCVFYLGTSSNVNVTGTVPTPVGPGGSWYQPINGTTPPGSSYWIRATLVSGTTPTGTLGSWLALSSARAWTLDGNTTAASNISCVIQIDISTSSGGSPIVSTGQYTLTASHV